MVGWDSASIGELCDVVNGGTPKTGVPEYWGGSHRWITPAEMGRRATPYIDRTERTITDRGLQNSSARQLPPYSVILSSRAPIGHLVINTVPMATNQGCKGLVPRNRIDHKFLYYFLGKNVDLLNDLGTGTTFKELSGGKLKEVRVPVPPVAEQRRIVATLDEAFEGIATAQANVEKNLHNARELFESYLQAVFIDCGPSWSSATIDQHIRFIDYRGRTPEKTSEGLRLITAKNVKKGFIQEEPMEYVSPDSYEAWMTRGIPRIGDVLFTTEAPLGNVAQLDTTDRVVFAQRIIIMQSDPAVLDSTFLKYMLLSAPVQAKIRAQATGATAQGIKASLLKQIEVAFPRNLAEQRAIIGRLDALADSADRLEDLYANRLKRLEELKKSLLHQAFIGAL
jgi:type I restriction enzyme, S subunit